jgi:hypothetical protein
MRAKFGGSAGLNSSGAGGKYVCTCVYSITVLLFNVLKKKIKSFFF